MNLQIFVLSMSLGLMTSLPSCKSSKKMNLNESNFVSIGSGGGFVGKESSYILSSNGEIHSGGQLIKKLKSSVCEQIFTNYKTLGLDKLEYDSPGNIYQFIEFKSADGMKRLTWNPSDNSFNKELKLFYDNFNYYLKK